MVTKVLNGYFGPSPRKSFVISSEDYVGNEEEMMSSQQRHALISLIFSKVQDKETRERWLNQVDGDLTAVDANDLYFSLLMSAK
jgi:hypothetical protein